MITVDKYTKKCNGTFVPFRIYEASPLFSIISKWFKHYKNKTNLHFIYVDRLGKLWFSNGNEITIDVCCGTWLPRVPTLSPQKILYRPELCNGQRTSCIFFLGNNVVAFIYEFLLCLPLVNAFRWINKK